MPDRPATSDCDSEIFRIEPGDYPDTRDEEARTRAGRVVHRQLSLLSPDVEENRRRIRQILEQLQAGQDQSKRDDAIPFDLWDAPAARTPVLVARDRIVVRTEHPANVRRRVGKHARTDALVPPTRDLPIDGYELVRRDQGKDTLIPEGASTNVFRSLTRKSPDELAADVQRLEALGVPASLNYIVPLGHIVKGDDFPEPATPLFPEFPPVLRSTGGDPGHPVRVAIIDTGISDEERPDGWLANVKRGSANIDQTDIMAPVDRLDWFAGHGTFAAGIVQQVAPDCEIVAYRFTGGDGVGTEQDVADAVLRAVQEAQEDNVQHLVINLSVGIPAVAGLPPIALRDAVEFVSLNHPDVVIVASAGNDGTSDEMFPAAFDQVVGVGALDAAMQPTSFSSFGPWVTCSCVGVGVVSTFVKGVLPPQPIPGRDDVKFESGAFAVWSGTSFSAPQVSGALARLSQLNGFSPRVALDVLLENHRTVPNFGVIIDDLLPGTPAVNTPSAAG